MKQQELWEQMDRLGIRTQEALERFMGNEALFLSFIRQLPEKLDLTQINQALKDEDEETFYIQVHNLRGMAANLGILPVWECAQAILVEFQGTKFKNKTKLANLLREAQTESETLAELIHRYLAEEEKI